MGTPLGAAPNLNFNGDGRPASEASLGQVSDVAFLPDDGTGARIVIADPFDHRVRLYDEDTGLVTTFAGTGVPPTFIDQIGDGGPATSGRLWEPSGVAAAEDGSVYITERLGCRIRRVDPGGIITTVAGTGHCSANPADTGPGPVTTLSQPFDVEVVGQTLYRTEIGSHLIRRMPFGGNVERVAGTGVAGFSGDGGPATAAQLSQPRGLGLGLTATVAYVADTNNHRIRRIDLTASPPVIGTLAGTGAPGFGGDGGPALSALLRFPHDVAPVGPNSLAISDRENNRVRLVGSLSGPTPSIGTIGGNGQRGRGTRGAAATGAKLSGPAGMASTAEPRIGFAEPASRRVAGLNLGTGPSVPGAPGGLNASIDSHQVDLGLGASERSADRLHGERTRHTRRPCRGLVAGRAAHALLGVGPSRRVPGDGAGLERAGNRTGIGVGDRLGPRRPVATGRTAEPHGRREQSDGHLRLGRCRRHARPLPHARLRRARRPPHRQSPLPGLLVRFRPPWPARPRPSARSR